MNNLSDERRLMRFYMLSKPAAEAGTIAWRIFRMACRLLLEKKQEGY